MKKMLVGLMLVAMGLLLMSPVASAFTVSINEQVTITQGTGGANNGGAFWINGEFETFCLERNEYFNPGGTYYVGSITDGAINGGIGGQTSPGFDPISSQTAYLYFQWATEAIVHTADNANDLQLAIWSLEGEITDNNYIPLTSGALGFKELAENASGLYGVQVMNIYGGSAAAAGANFNDPKQDMLVYNAVPEPASVLLFGLGLLGISAIRRRFKK